jgi:hypothetical protein
MSKFDDAIEIAQTDDWGACRCILAEGVELLICDQGELFIMSNHRPNKRAERIVSADWAYRLLAHTAHFVRLQASSN